MIKTLDKQIDYGIIKAEEEEEKVTAKRLTKITVLK